jgi:cytochrome c oxidase cbb3-type subunit 2
MNKLVLIVGGSTLVYACLAVLMAILPGIELSKIPAGPNVVPLTPLQAEGRDVYVANGCSYCHTQQVRPLQQDKVFGRPSMAGDFKYQTPELLGSERTGPDLTNIGVRQPSAVWQYLHLYNPRAVVRESIMPAFSWVFDGLPAERGGANVGAWRKAYAPAQGVVVPTHAAEALIAYLASLKQPALSAADVARSAGSMAAMAEPAAPAVAATAADGAGAPTPAANATYDPTKGAALFTANCASCHQATGEGLPGAFPPLKGNAAVNDDDATQHMHVVLRGAHDLVIDGVKYGSPMPPFADMLSDADIANIIDYERGAWGNHGKPVTAADVAAERAKTP